MDDDGIKIDPLAVGLTRPAMKWGVPYPALMLNLIASVEALVWTRSLLWMLICVPLHGICYLVCLKDPRAFELLLLWLRTKANCMVATLGYWAASSYSPLEPGGRITFIQRWRVQSRLKRENKHAES
ncbi:type IV secretion system protein VirB3 [uncultured Massilia sp.]|uniref:type IV secretion system protein VirB3 n=1 Tax=uncultured Massilia sp. TaxID=169973 RepID=UPI0025D8ED48|nr:type IV secretion system protein VirB3 [uncultured Massilia sp.]